MAELTRIETNKKALSRALNSGTFNQVRLLLNGMPPAEIAHLLETTPPKQREILWKLLDTDLEGEVLQYLSEEIRSQFVRAMDMDELVQVTADLDTDDLVDLLQDLPDSVTREILNNMDAQNRARTEAALAYPEDTAGGLMNTDVVTVRANITLDTVLRYLRMHSDLPNSTDHLIVVNRQDEYVGILPLSKLLTSDTSSTVREAMNTEIEPINVHMPASEVAKIFERLDLISAPVVDDHNKLVGRITIDDVVDVIREQADHSLMGMAGLDDDEATFGPVLSTARRRAIWLGVNLITAFIASAVIGLFTETINKVVALAVLMPIVASMGGIAGSQTITLVIRAQALGMIASNNIRYLITKEFLVGALNGMVWAVVVGGAASLWFDDYRIGLVIASAMLINLIIAGLSGVTLPLVMRKLKIDPALAGGVVLTTITDVVGFLTFLGLATLVFG